MMIGKFPTKEFFQKCGLENEYFILSEACMHGDIITLEAELDKKMSLYLNSGIYFLMDQLELN